MSVSKRRRSSKRCINRCEGIAIPRDHTPRRDFRSTRTSKMTRRRDPHWSLVADTGGQLSRTRRNALSPAGWRGGCHACPGGASHDDRADQCKSFLPTLRGYADLGEAQGRVIGGDGRRPGEKQRDCGTDDRRAHGGDGDLPANQGDQGRDRADHDCPDWTRASVVGA